MATCGLDLPQLEMFPYMHPFKKVLQVPGMLNPKAQHFGFLKPRNPKGWTREANTLLMDVCCGETGSMSNVKALEKLTGHTKRTGWLVVCTWEVVFAQLIHKKPNTSHILQYIYYIYALIYIYIPWVQCRVFFSVQGARHRHVKVPVIRTY